MVAQPTAASDRSAAAATWPQSAAAQSPFTPIAEIRADIREHGVSERGVLRRHCATDALDAPDHRRRTDR
jgi:hypothetical protein